MLIWSAALILGGIIGDWAKAAYFAANSYTALGEPFSLPHRLAHPRATTIMAISASSPSPGRRARARQFRGYNQIRDRRLAQARKARATTEPDPAGYSKGATSDAAPSNSRSRGRRAARRPSTGRALRT